ncbi:MAG: hypothetical protein NVSMB26_19270 [Beijerinckiaceae bacterium]
MTSLREASELAQRAPLTGAMSADQRQHFADAVHHLDIRLEAIETVLAALTRKTGLMYEETTSPEAQGFEKPPDQQKRSAEVLLQIQRLLEGSAESLHSG